MQHRIKPYEGLFITLEGGDGAGKSTLTEKLVEELQKKGYEVVRTREPGGSALSEHIRNLVLHPPAALKIGDRAELLLFLAARLEHIEELILPALRASKVVICERFNDSTIAYQGCARHLGMAHVEMLCHLACDSLEPDATLFLDLDPVIGFSRIVKQRGKALDRLESEELQFHSEVRQGFLHLADKYPERIAVIDASLPIEEVTREAMKALAPHLMLRPLKS